MKKFTIKGIKIQKETIADIVKSTLISLIIAIILVLILALVVKLTNLGAEIISPINQAIKIVSILGGAFLGIKRVEKGALKGGFAGLLFSLISMFLFTSIEGSSILALSTLVDVVAGTVAGIISGIIVVNVKPQR